MALVWSVPAGAGGEPHPVGGAVTATSAGHSGLGVSAASAEEYFAQLLPTIRWISALPTRDGPEVFGLAEFQQCGVYLNGPSGDLDEMAFFCRAEPKAALPPQVVHYLTTVAQRFTTAAAGQWSAQEVMAATAALARTRKAARVARLTTAGTHIKMSGVMYRGTRRQATIAITAQGVKPLPPQT
jgi:hypothetical protein